MLTSVFISHLRSRQFQSMLWSRLYKTGLKEIFTFSHPILTPTFPQLIISLSNSLIFFLFQTEWLPQRVASGQQGLSYLNKPSTFPLCSSFAQLHKQENKNTEQNLASQFFGLRSFG